MSVVEKIAIGLTVPAFFGFIQVGLFVGLVTASFICSVIGSQTSLDGIASSRIEKVVCWFCFDCGAVTSFAFIALYLSLFWDRQESICLKRLLLINCMWLIACLVAFGLRAFFSQVHGLN
jgi:hypothetical protein